MKAAPQEPRGPTARTIGAVGQVGLGIMGGAYARHLLAAGYRVAGYDLDAKRRAAFKRLGGMPARSIAEVASHAKVLITSLPSVAAVEAVFFGAAGLAEVAAAGTVVVETSTLPLELKLELERRCKERSITVLDCPISGTGAQAAAKDISIYASGARKAVQTHRAVLEAFSRSVHYCGDYGNGSRLKFVANLLVTIHNLSAAEAIVLGRRSGLDLDLLYRAIADGAGTSRMFDVRAPMMIARDYANATMKIDVYQKDIDIIGDYAAGLHCPVPLFEASRAYYAAAYAQGRAGEDTAAICAVLEEMAGTRPASSRRPLKRQRRNPRP